MSLITPSCGYCEMVPSMSSSSVCLAVGDVEPHRRVATIQPMSLSDVDLGAAVRIRSPSRRPQPLSSQPTNGHRQRLRQRHGLRRRPRGSRWLGRTRPASVSTRRQPCSGRSPCNTRSVLLRRCQARDRSPSHACTVPLDDRPGCSRGSPCPRPGSRSTSPPAWGGGRCWWSARSS